jgi:hypothetical protein
VLGSKGEGTVVDGTMLTLEVELGAAEENVVVEAADAGTSTQAAKPDRENENQRLLFFSFQFRDVDLPSSRYWQLEPTAGFQL